MSLGFKFKTREIIRFSLKPYLSIGFKIKFNTGPHHPKKKKKKKVQMCNDAKYKILFY